VRTIDRQVYVTADGAGAASAVLPQVPWGERWRLTRLAASSSDPAAYGTLRCWRNVAGADFIDGTSAAQSDVSELGTSGVELHAGEQVVATWSDCTAGAPFSLVATFQVM
jgi:hypothetical protein